MTTLHRPAAPGPADLIAWPEAFGTRFTVFVDTEEEFDWNAPLSRDGHGVSAIAAVPDAHRRFADRGVPLTYMIDYPVAADAHAVDILRGVLADDQSAVGAQLHGWVTPPFREALTPANSFVGNLSEALELAKIDVLTDALAAAFGARPLAFRAGRYGVGPNTLRLLAERGYALDSSMRSRYGYAADGGPDFAAIGNAAFRRDGVVELPLTTIHTGLLRGAGARLYSALGQVPRGRGLFAHARLLSRVALTPEDMPLPDAREAVAVAVGEGLRLLNFSFHSPSLVPGHTPYVRDEADLAAFRHWWDVVLGDLARLGVRSATLGDILAASRAGA